MTVQRETAFQLARASLEKAKVAVQASMTMCAAQSFRGLEEGIQMAMAELRAALRWATPEPDMSTELEGQLSLDA